MGEGTNWNMSEGAALLGSSCWWSSCHSFHAFSRTPQAFPFVVTKSRSCLELQGCTICCSIFLGSPWSEITCQQADRGGMCFCVSMGVEVALGVRGREVGSPPTWMASSHASFPHPPPLSLSYLFSYLFPCSCDSLLLETLLHIS